eukprot:c18954_g1_i1.p1 GENE.c18954_g1_i1~~c18954_g1_i1.p1  ORF type:complete len:199 (+),score=38.59 c18954_g1_i1:508-1104(+)
MNPIIAAKEGLVPAQRMSKAALERLKQDDETGLAPFCPDYSCEGIEFYHMNGCVPSFERYGVSYMWTLDRGASFDMLGHDSWERDENGQIIQFLEYAIQPPLDWEVAVYGNEFPVKQIWHNPGIDDLSRAVGKLKRLKWALARHNRKVAKYERIVREIENSPDGTRNPTIKKPKRRKLIRLKKSMKSRAKSRGWKSAT